MFTRGEELEISLYDYIKGGKVDIHGDDKEANNLEKELKEGLKSIN